VTYADVSIPLLVVLSIFIRSKRTVAALRVILKGPLGIRVERGIGPGGGFVKLPGLVYAAPLFVQIRVGPLASVYLHTSAYVSILQHTSGYVHAAPLFVQIRVGPLASVYLHTSAYVSIRQHTSAYVSIRQHTSAYVSVYLDRCRILLHLQVRLLRPYAPIVSSLTWQSRGLVSRAEV
jgi:hypothetical protein